MKRYVAVMLCVLLLASCAALCVSAADPEWYHFEPVGEVPVRWDPTIAFKIEMDGDLADWVAAGYSFYTIDVNNMAFWQGSPADMEDFAINAYFAADADYLYVAFHITDRYFAYCENIYSYDGDAFQIAIDFNSEIARAMAVNPEGMTKKESIYYSFACRSDGEPLNITVQHSGGGDGQYTEENSDGDVKGAARKTPGGWDAEFALSWDMLCRHYVDKYWADGYEATWDEDHPLTLGTTLCYINRTVNGGVVKQACGTFIDKDDMTWTAADSGMTLRLDYVYGAQIHCEAVKSPEVDPGEITTEETVTEPTEETTADVPTETSAETTEEAPAETTAEPTTETFAETTAEPAPETTAAATTGTDGETSANSDTDPAPEGGCRSAVVASPLATSFLPTTLLAAAAICRKKRKERQE